MTRITILLAYCIALSISNVMTLSSQPYDYYPIGNPIDIVTQPTGGICLMGGGVEDDQAMKWFLNRANGGDVVVLRTSGSDGYNDYFFEDLRVPINSVQTFVCHNRESAYDSLLLEAVKRAEAIWFAGGNQATYVGYWRDTPLDSMISAKVELENLVIGGTSAGMAILGGYYFSARRGSISSAEALLDPIDDRSAIDTASFINHPLLSKVITDTHFGERDRAGRLAVFMAHIFQQYEQIPFAIAADEGIAICIDPGGIASVFGKSSGDLGYAYFVTTNCLKDDQTPEVYSQGTPLTWNRQKQALQVCKLRGTSIGSLQFDLINWSAKEDADWEFWYVDNGDFSKDEGQPRRCEKITGLKSPNFKLYPNPAKSIEELILPDNISSYSLTDLQGSMIFEWNTTSSHLSPGHPELSDGMYLLQMLFDSQKTSVERLIIKAER